MKKAVMLYQIKTCVSYACVFTFGVLLVSLKPMVVSKAEIVAVPEIVLTEPLRDPVLPVRVFTLDGAVDVSVTRGEYDPVEKEWDIGTTSAYFAAPSQPLNYDGATLVYAHNRSNLFSGLHELSQGDAIQVESDDGKMVQYILSATSVVEPEDTSVFRSSGEHSLVLQTCTGDWSEKRVLFEFKQAQST